jgi:hypothetical protein
VSINVVSVEFVDEDGAIVEYLAAEDAYLLNYLATEQEPYDGGAYRAVITDSTEVVPAVEAKLVSLDSRHESVITETQSIQCHRDAAGSYVSPKFIMYHGPIAAGTKQHFEVQGYTLMPSSWAGIWYQGAATKKIGSFFFGLDVNRDGKIETGLGATLDCKLTYTPGYVGSRQVLTHQPFTPQVMDLMVDGLLPETTAVTFELANVSSHRGICANYGTATGADFSFAGGSSGPINVPVSKGVGSVPIYCNDFGGRCEVVLRIGGKEIDRLEIPYDRDDDGISDAWEHRQLPGLRLGGHVPSDAKIAAIGADWDEELPINDYFNKNRGDALPAIDEYRGLIIGGKHVRTSLSEKDVFIHKIPLTFLGKVRTIDGPYPSEIWAELRYRLHVLLSAEYETSTGPSYRRVNVNSLSAAGLYQHCVILKVVNEDPATVGEKPETLARIYPKNIARGTPADVDVIKFFVNEYCLGRTPAWPGYSPITGYKAVWRKKASKHELGHALYLDHGADEETPGPGVSQTNHTMNCIMRSKAYQLVPDQKTFCDQNCTIETKVK